MQITLPMMEKSPVADEISTEENGYSRAHCCFALKYVIKMLDHQRVLSNCLLRFKSIM